MPSDKYQNTGKPTHNTMKLFLSIRDSAPWNLHEGSSLVPSSILAPLGGIGLVNIFHQVLTYECIGNYIFTIHCRMLSTTLFISYVYS